MMLLALLMSLDDECVALGHFGYSIMEGRQINVPMSEMMRLAEDDPLLENIVRQAYLVPAGSKSPKDFQQEIETKCYAN